MAINFKTNKKLHWDFSNLERFKLELEKGKEAGSKGVLNNILVGFGSITLNFLHSRFKKMSKGGWPKRKDSKKHPILIKTKTLLNSLIKGRKGNEFKRIESGIVVGYNNSDRHPEYKGKIIDLASLHHNGKGKLPKREILAQPDSQTVSKYQSIIIKEFKKFTGTLK